MCRICVEWEKGKMTAEEAFSAIGEMLATEESEEKVNHLLDLSGKVLDKENPFDEWKEEYHGFYIEDLDKDLSTDDQ